MANPETPEIENAAGVNGEDKGWSILREEFEKALQEMRNGKAVEVDGIPIELIKNMKEEAKTEIFRLCNDIYSTGEWPEDFLQTILILLEKKTNALLVGKGNVRRSSNLPSASHCWNEQKKIKQTLLPPDPASCCMKACPDCVGIQYAQQINQNLYHASEITRIKIMENVPDPKVRAYLFERLGYKKEEN